MGQRPMIIGMAGHIDHGKSALVEALTGRPMDPFAEERRRGITLDLHVAPLPLDENTIAGVVDVPGHEDLVRTMVAGAAGVDLVLLVIAADEGIMPQSREHLAVVEQLRIPRGIPVLTKSDLVEPEWLGMVEEEVRTWLASSPVSFEPPVVTSARTGAGTDALRSAIREVAQWLPPPRADDLARLPIDRAFSRPGTGTVITGTAWSGAFQAGDAVRVLPGNHAARIRTLERHGQPVPKASAGERVACGLTGLPLDAVERGSVLVSGSDPWQESSALDAAVEVLPEAPRPLRHQTRLRVHLGTAEVLARVHLGAAIAPGSSGLVRLALERPLVARGEDRIVLRSYSPVTVIGGGWIVDPCPPRGRVRWPGGLADPDPLHRLRALLSRRPAGASEGEVAQLVGEPPSIVSALCRDPSIAAVGNLVILHRQIEEATSVAREAVSSFHRDHSREDGMPLETLRHTLRQYHVAVNPAIDWLVTQGELEIERGIIRRVGFRSAIQGGAEATERVLALVEEAGLSPPTVSEIAVTLSIPTTADLLRRIAAAGRVVAVEPDRYFARRALDEFARALGEVAAQGPITPAALREATGLTRKYLIPLLEWADRSGLTRRQGDARVPGPALGVTKLER